MQIIKYLVKKKKKEVGMFHSSFLPMLYNVYPAYYTIVVAVEI